MYIYTKSFIYGNPRDKATISFQLKTFCLYIELIHVLLLYKSKQKEMNKLFSWNLEDLKECRFEKLRKGCCIVCNTPILKSNVYVDEHIGFKYGCVECKKKHDINYIQLTDSILLSDRFSPDIIKDIKTNNFGSYLTKNGEGFFFNTY